MFSGAVACRGHVRVHVVTVLQLTLGVLRLQRVEVVQVAQLQVLISATSGLWEKGNKQQTRHRLIRCHELQKRINNIMTRHWEFTLPPGLYRTCGPLTLISHVQVVYLF